MTTTTKKKKSASEVDVSKRTHSSSGVCAFVFSLDESVVACVVGLVVASGAHSFIHTLD